MTNVNSCAYLGDTECFVNNFILYKTILKSYLDPVQCVDAVHTIASFTAVNTHASSHD